MLSATFVMEQHIGHRAYYENLRRFIEPNPLIQSNWVEVTYEGDVSRWTSLPLLPTNVRGSLVGRSQARRGLGQRAADVAVFNTQVPAVLCGETLHRQPYVICTDITPIQYDELAEHYGHRPDNCGLVKWYKHRANARILQGAAKVVPWSIWTARSIVEDYGVDASRVEVISPGVDLDVWKPAPVEHVGPVRILFVGGDFHRKGGDELLAAFRTLPTGSAELLLVTRTELPSERGVTVYHDMRPNSPELITLYQSCDVFALPTKAEAFGIAAVEASATGLPVLATGVGGLTDIVIDGETGCLFPPGDVRALTDHLRCLVADRNLRRRLGRGARAWAEELFDARRNASRMATLLEQIVMER